jgi:hypothetical protein
VGGQWHTVDTRYLYAMNATGQWVGTWVHEISDARGRAPTHFRVRIGVRSHRHRSLVQIPCRQAELHSARPFDTCRLRRPEVHQHLPSLGGQGEVRVVRPSDPVDRESVALARPGGRMHLQHRV